MNREPKNRNNNNNNNHKNNNKQQLAANERTNVRTNDLQRHNNSQST